LIFRQALQPQLAAGKAAADDGCEYSQDAVNPLADTSGVVQKRNEGNKPDQDDKGTLGNTQRTGLEAHDMLHIGGNQHQANATEEDNEICLANTGQHGESFVKVIAAIVSKKTRYVPAKYRDGDDCTAGSHDMLSRMPRSVVDRWVKPRVQ